MFLHFQIRIGNIRFKNNTHLLDANQPNWLLVMLPHSLLRFVVAVVVVPTIKFRKMLIIKSIATAARVRKLVIGQKQWPIIILIVMGCE